jgi:hypothetical protein
MPEVSSFSDHSSFDIHAAGEPPAKLLLSKKDCAHCLSLSLRSISHLIARGELKIRRIGGRTLISADELARFSRRDHLRLTK